MKLTKAFITTVAVTIAVMGAAFVAVTASSGMFGFHDWPEAPAAAPQASAVDVSDAPAPADEPRADARRRPQPAGEADGALVAALPPRAVATAPSPRPASPRRAPAVAPASEPRDAGTGSPAQQSQPDPETGPPPAVPPLPAPEPLPPVALEVPAKEIPDDPDVIVPTWDGPDQARRHTRPGRTDGTD